jgi:hypothetical protein
MSSSSDVTPQQIGKAFVVQYYRLLHEHPESLYRFYSSSSTLMHDDPNKTVTGIENITKRIEELSLKQRHVKIRQVDCHSTVGSSVVVQVCGEISSTSITDNQTPIMKRFVQTFVLAPTSDAKQKYYVHNDIFRYQDNPSSTTDNNNTKISSITTDNEGKRYAKRNNPVLREFVVVASFGSVPTKQTDVQTPSSSIDIQFTDNTVTKKEEKSVVSANATENFTPPITPVDEQQKTQSTKPKSYRDAIAKKEKVTTTTTTNENSSTPGATAASGTKATKSGKQKSSKSANKNARAARGHPQDANDYYDDSWYYGPDEIGYLHTGYTDDQEIFVGNLSAQVTEEQVKRKRRVSLKCFYFKFRFMNYFDPMVDFFLFVLAIQDLKLVQRISLLLFVNRLKWLKQLSLIIMIFSIINKLMLKLKNVDLFLIHFVQHIQQLLHQRIINQPVIQLHIMNTHHHQQQHHFMMEEFLAEEVDVEGKEEHIRKEFCCCLFGSSDIIIIIIVVICV